MLKEDILKDLESVSRKEKAIGLSRFFKTGKGEYGQGDIFAGITVPSIRTFAKKYSKIVSLEDLLFFLQYKIHEYRLFALLTMTYRYKKAEEKVKKEIFNMYLANLEYVNNWDLVDLSAPNIVGDYLLDKDRDILYELARSNILWKQRVAILSTFAFIRKEQFDDTLEISKILLHHEHDLIHKAVGWMLREVGRKDLKVEEGFLKRYYKEMPRTMLRYSIEKFEESKRLRYLHGEI